MTDDLAGQVRSGRTSPGLFALRDEGPGQQGFGRAVVGVSGGDAERWLDGMVSNDITAISAAGPLSGCHAALLTTRGRIVADLHVLAREDGYWLETASHAVAALSAQLEKYIVADDVTLEDLSDRVARLGIEGPGSTELLAGLAGESPASLEAVAPHAWQPLQLAAAEVAAVRFGWSGEEAWQLLVPPADAEAVEAGLQAAGALPRSLAALEVLRIEAGVPRLGAELHDGVFPDEARLESAISRSKGCYTGQEIVARLYSRGAVNHLLVGLRFEAPSPPPVDAGLEAGDKQTGEVTSACLSPAAGAIGLGFVRREHSEPGTRLRCRGPDGDCEVTVAELPLVEAGASG